MLAENVIAKSKQFAAAAGSEPSDNKCFVGALPPNTVQPKALTNAFQSVMK